MEEQDVQQQKRSKVGEHDDSNSIWDMISQVQMEINDDEEEEIWRQWTIGYMQEDGELAFDDVTGQALDVEAVKNARAEEMRFVKGIPVYEERDVEECWRRLDKKPIATN